MEQSLDIGEKNERKESKTSDGSINYIRRFLKIIPSDKARILMGYTEAYPKNYTILYELNRTISIKTDSNKYEMVITKICNSKEKKKSAVGDEITTIKTRNEITKEKAIEIVEIIKEFGMEMLTYSSDNANSKYIAFFFEDY